MRCPFSRWQSVVSHLVIDKDANILMCYFLDFHGTYFATVILL